MNQWRKSITSSSGVFPKSEECAESRAESGKLERGCEHNAKFEGSEIGLTLPGIQELGKEKKKEVIE